MARIYPSDQLRWLWFAIGALMAPFMLAQTTLWFAAWLAPIFLLRFTRTTPASVAMPSLWIMFVLAGGVAFRGGFMPYDGVLTYVTVGGIALAYVVVFAIDRQLWNRHSGVTSTLVFPLASTTVSFLATVGNPLGTAGSEAYSQNHLALLQLVSVTGIWGVVFLMAWLAAVLNALWERGWKLRLEWPAVTIFGVAVLSVFILGSLRLTFFAPVSETVRVAAIAPNRELNLLANGRKLDSLEERTASRAILNPLLDDLFRRTEQEALAGAKIIVWSEGAARILKEDEAALLGQAQKLATTYAIYLQIGINAYLDQTKIPKSENRSIMITPEGKVAWDYHKVNVTPGDPETPGSGNIPFLDTAYGRLATIICQDDLFPNFVKRTGLNDVDILLVPSNDWQAVADWHAKVATFRAIENGVTIVRPTGQGVSTAVDSVGRVVAHKADYFLAKDEQTLIVAAPTRGTQTLFPFIGDSFAYLSAIALLGLGAWSALRKGSGA